MNEAPPSGFDYVDSHCHLDFPELHARLPEVMANMGRASVGRALCVGVSLEHAGQVLDVARSHACLDASVGVHPQYRDCAEPDVEGLCRLAQDANVVAIGETGLDYFRAEGDCAWQRERFRIHIRAGVACGLPLIIHTREAGADTVNILKEEGAGRVGGVMHCFTDTWDTAAAALELGFHVSFSGILTFRNAAAVREVAARVPRERLLIETDAPYLAPMPHRGASNEPAWVVHVAATLGELHHMSAENMGRLTRDNYFRLFAKALPA